MIYHRSAEILVQNELFQRHDMATCIDVTQKQETMINKKHVIEKRLFHQLVTM